MVKNKKGLSRVESAGGVNLYNEELKETLVEAGTASSGWTEERDADRRMESMEEKGTEKVKAKKKK